VTGEVKAPFPHDQVIELDGKPATNRSWEMPPFSMTVKAFCATCNNGWMSELEEAAKGLILAWFRGWGATWHRRQQRELATWVLLKAIVLDQTHPASPVVPPEIAAYLYTHKTPPDRLWVWLTACDPDLVAFYSFQGVEITSSDSEAPPEEPTVYVVTFTIGPLVFQLGGTILQGFNYLDDVVYPQLESVRLWPYTTGRVAFSPRRLMSQRSLEIFATAIFDDLQKRVPDTDRIEPVRGPREEDAKT
jgi:hypothetical protein